MNDFDFRSGAADALQFLSPAKSADRAITCHLLSDASARRADFVGD